MPHLFMNLKASSLWDSEHLAPVLVYSEKNIIPRSTLLMQRWLSLLNLILTGLFFKSQWTETGSCDSCMVLFIYLLLIETW